MQQSSGDSAKTPSVTPLPARKTLNDALRSLLLQIKDRKIAAFEPIFQQGIGYRYPNLEGYDGFQKQIAVLQQLENEGFLTSELLESVLQCPACSATRFSVQQSCTVCQSTNVTRGAVTEHLACGNIDFDSKYAIEAGTASGGGEENVLVCPKCRKRLKAIGVDYAKPGIFYKCLNCKALLPQTASLYTCLDCCKSWQDDQLKELQLMKYDVNMEMVSSYFLEYNLLPLVAKRLFTKHGVKAESPGKVRGLPKIEHSFDLLVSHYENGEPMLVADLLIDSKDNNISNYGSSSQQLQSIRILAFYAKCLDASYSTTRIIKKILVVQSELSKEAKELATAYGVTIVERADVEMMASLILKMLASSSGPLQA